MTKILAFDTATDACSAALFIDDEIIDISHIAPRKHAELLLPMCDDLLARAQVTVTELDAIAFGEGPGSFMGTRIAAGIAQGIAYSADLPVIPISTLATLAQSAVDAGMIANHIAAAWDARMQQLYWGVYSIKDHLVVNSFADQLSDPQAVAITHKALLVGNAWEIYQEQLPAQFLQQHCLHSMPLYPQACSLAKLAARHFAAGECFDPASVEPLYLRNNIVRS